LDGAYSAIADDETAFSGGRSPRYAVFIIAVCPTPELLTADRAWVRSTWAALLPHTTETGVYVNALDTSEESRVKAAYGPASTTAWPRSRPSTTRPISSTTTQHQAVLTSGEPGFHGL